LVKATAEEMWITGSNPVRITNVLRTKNK